MPPSDLSHPYQSPSRRIHRQAPTHDEVARRRFNGEISCAECKRLKLKCSRVVPCEACVRRGYAHLCPNDVVIVGAGSSKYSDKILHAPSSQRIRELEQALASAHSRFSADPHPLLIPSDVTSGSDSPPCVTASLATATRALGTLTIGDSGQTSYFGSTAGSEALFMIGARMNAKESEVFDEPSTTDSQVAERASQIEINTLIANAQRSDMFINPEGKQNLEQGYYDALQYLLRQLPDKLRASTLFEAFDEHFGWMVQPQSREANLSSYLKPSYNARSQVEIGSDAWQDFQPQVLSILYSLLCLGALGDLTLPPHNDEAKRYHRYARAAFQLRHLLAPATCDTVYALLMLAHCELHSGSFNGMDSSWALISMAVNTAQAIGLHRNCAEWGMDANTTENRRKLWWELYTANAMTSVHLGRCPAIHHTFVDCPYPESSAERLYIAKYEIVQQVIVPVLELTGAVKEPNYDQVLEMDRKMRNLILKSQENAVISSSETKPTQLTGGGFIRSNTLEWTRSLCNLLIHRSYFAKALIDFPSNPLKSPYAISFLATYRCSSWIVKMSSDFYEVIGDLSTRLWQFWQQLFNAGIILASIVSKSPGCHVAATAFVELNLAVNIYGRGAASTRRARSGLVLLRKARKKAEAIFSAYQSSGIEPEVKPAGDLRDFVAVFGGQTRLVDMNKTFPNGPKAFMPPSQPLKQESLPGSTFSPKATDLHPSLEAFMGFFPASAFAPGFDLTGNILAESVPSVEIGSYEYPSLQALPHPSPSPPDDVSLNSVSSGSHISTPYLPGDLNQFGEMLPAAFPDYNAFDFAPPFGLMDNFMMDLMPDMRSTSGNDQWRMFLADSGIPSLPVK